ncbi:hypothetical protein ABZX92_02450 [Lentzea sp. NPDC006480]|uniref:hypothetical protein n=1 Tax=Lentzea sp. NPDC006480 TaxID=3157176 RepID=UPI0033A774DA
MQNAFDLFQSIVLMQGTQCARRIHLENQLRKDLKGHPFSVAGLQSARESLRRDLDQLKVISTDDESRAVLALRELERANVAAERDREALEKLTSFTPTQSKLTQIRDDVADFYLTLQIDVTEVPVRVVERLPEPYASKGFSALTADMGDKRKHGIEPGIYFDESAISPFLADYFIAHEIIHVWLGFRSPDESCTLLEEGLAELLSIFGYVARTFGLAAAENLYKIFRLNSNAATRFESYVDGIRQALFTAESLGAVGQLIENARLGRPQLNAAFDRSLTSTHTESKIDGNPTQEHTGLETGAKVARSLLSSFPRSLVVSAPAFIVAELAHDGMTFRELAHASKLESDLVSSAVAELDARALVTLRRDGQVVSRNLAREHLERGHLRFDFRPVGSLG